MKIRNGFVSNSSSSSFVVSDVEKAKANAEKLRNLRKKKLDRILKKINQKDNEIKNKEI